MFPSRVTRDDHLSTRQYARLVGEWVGAIGLSAAAYGTHSLRRMLGHAKVESTVRYLGVDLEDALALSEATEI